MAEHASRRRSHAQLDRPHRREDRCDRARLQQVLSRADVRRLHCRLHVRPRRPVGPGAEGEGQGPRRCAEAAEEEDRLEDREGLHEGRAPHRRRGEEEERAATARCRRTAPTKAKGPAKKSAFHPEVEDLLDVIYNSTGKAVAAGLSSSAGATKASPLGNLADAQLDKGADILEEIEKQLAKKPKKARSSS